MRWIVLSQIFLFASASIGTDLDSSKNVILERNRILELAATEGESVFTEFRRLLSLPNDAHNNADILRLLDWLEPAFAARGFLTRRLRTAGNPLLLVERVNHGADKTVLIYLQADGQPVDATKWNQEDPYKAVLKEKDSDGNWIPIPWESVSGERNPEWRIFARSASDSKGPIMQFLASFDALQKAGVEPPFSIKVLIDTEEELGSPNLAAAVAEYRGELTADMLLIFDGPPHSSNKPTLVFGARGIATATLVTYGPRLPQHSGHYGNYVPNPISRMADVLSSLKLPNGRVAIPGFYDGVSLGADERRLLDQVPDDLEKLNREIGIAASEAVAPTLQESLQYPSLNVRGIASGWVGSEARTIIPATAIAEIDIRLVRETDPDRLLFLLGKHVEDMGYLVLDRMPTDKERLSYPKIMTIRSEISYKAFRSDFDSLSGNFARKGMRKLFEKDPIMIRTYGGSIPIAPFVDNLFIPAVIIPTVNIDNNQHSPNENIRIGNFIEGIAIMISILSQQID